MIVFAKKSSHPDSYRDVMGLFFDDEQTLLVNRNADGQLAEKESAEN